MPIPSEMTGFIRNQKAATVCCIENHAPYCFNCFYAFMEEEGWLIYKSSSATRHEKILQHSRLVAGTIIPEEIAVATIQGIQFEGEILEDRLGASVKATAAYYFRFPFAAAVPGMIRIIALNHIKFTDNTRGFGHKESWNREDGTA